MVVVFTNQTYTKFKALQVVNVGMCNCITLFNILYFVTANQNMLNVYSG